MRTPLLITLVVLVHGLALGTLVCMQGCGTPTTPSGGAYVEPPLAPVMPPPAAPVEPVQPALLRPPAPMQPEGRLSEEAVMGTYEVRSGDALSVIARRHGLTVRELADLNGIKDVNVLRVGQPLKIPGLAGGAAGASKPAAPSASKPSAPPVEGVVQHVVRSGDTLSGLAYRYGVTAASIRDANALSSDVIRISQKLLIPGGKPRAGTSRAAPAASKPAAPKTETPAAAKPETPAAPKTDLPADLKPEPPETPAAPAPAAAEATPAPAAPAPIEGAGQPIPYPVGQGDTLDSIAKSFLVSKEAILRLNNLTDASQIKSGDTIMIPPSE